MLVGGVFLGSMTWWVGLTAGTLGLRHLASELVLHLVNRISAAILLFAGAALLIVALRGLGATAMT